MGESGTQPPPPKSPSVWAPRIPCSHLPPTPKNSGIWASYLQPCRPLLVEAPWVCAHLSHARQCHLVQTHLSNVCVSLSPALCCFWGGAYTSHLHGIPGSQNLPPPGWDESEVMIGWHVSGAVGHCVAWVGGQGLSLSEMWGMGACMVIGWAVSGVIGWDRPGILHCDWLGWAGDWEWLCPGQGL